MDKRVTVFYAKNEEEAKQILLFLKANGIEADRQGLGKGAYRDIYGGNAAYGEEILVAEEDEKRACDVVKAYLARKEKPAEKRNLAGKLLVAVAVVLVVLLIVANNL